MQDLVVDTDVVSYGFRGDRRFLDHYGPAMQGARLILSFMTSAELSYGAEVRGWGKMRRDDLSVYLSRYYVRYGVSVELCDRWAELMAESKRIGRILHVADGWIAATASVLNVPLVTHNAKDYASLRDVTLITFPDV